MATAKSKTIRKAIHEQNRSYETIIKTVSEKKVKYTYQAANAYEKCTVEIFDGYKWNHTLSMLDLGELPNSSIYVHDANTRISRAKSLFRICNTMLAEIL